MSDYDKKIGLPPPPERTHSSAMWQPREQQEIEQSVVRYSRFVARMKVALPVIAGAILLLVLVLPQIRTETDRFRIGIKNLTEATTSTLSMVNARYFGTNEKGEPYEVTAKTVHERATEEANGARLVDLTDPRAKLTTQSGNEVRVGGTTGIYSRKDQILDLAGQVDVSDQQGYEMHTSAARVHLHDNVATGDQPVTVKGPFGDVQATGFIAKQNDKVLIFKGPATLVLKTDNKQDDASTANAPASNASGATPPAKVKP